MKNTKTKLLLAFVSLVSLLILLSGCQQVAVKEPLNGTSVQSSASETVPQETTESGTRLENNSEDTFATHKATEVSAGETQNPEISETAAWDTKDDFSQNSGGIVLPDDNW